MGLCKCLRLNTVFEDRELNNIKFRAYRHAYRLARAKSTLHSVAEAGPLSDQEGKT